jgi:hypothetical protein
VTVQTATPDLWLSPAEDHSEAVARLLATTPRVGFSGVCADLNRDAEEVTVPSSLEADGLAWDASDNGSERWWPGAVARVGRYVVASWTSRSFQGQDHGCRLTVLDPASERYRHVLVMSVGDSFGELVLRPVQVDATGFVVTADGTVVLAAGRRGVFLARLEDVVAVEPSAETFGYRYVLPVRAQLRGETGGPGERLRCDLLTLDGSSLVVAEDGAAGADRVVRFPLPRPEDHVRATAADRHGLGEVTGLAVLDGVRYVARDQGRRPGELVVGSGAPADRQRRKQLSRALPPGPGGLAAHDGRLWGVTRPVGRRMVFSVAPGA